MASVKNFADNTIYAGIPTEARLVRAKAAQEHLEAVVASLQKDQTMINELVKALGYESEEEVWADVPKTSESTYGQALHHAYLNILLRTLLRSDSPEFSDNVRARFGSKAIIKNIRETDLSATNEETMKAKFINLLEVHGEVKAPNAWERFKAWFKNRGENEGGLVSGQVSN